MFEPSSDADRGISLPVGLVGGQGKVDGVMIGWSLEPYETLTSTPLLLIQHLRRAAKLPSHNSIHLLCEGRVEWPPNKLIDDGEDNLGPPDVPPSLG